MKMTRVSTLRSVLLAVVVTLGLAACGGAKADSGAEFVGVWELSAVEGDSETTDDDIAEAKEFGLVVLLSLDEDGTGVFDLLGDTEPVTWKATGGNKGTLESEGMKGQIHFEDGKLKLIDGAETLIFTPSTGTPPSSVEIEDEVEFEEEEAEAASMVDVADGVVILDNEYATITVLGVGVDWADDVGYLVNIHNNSDETLDFLAVWDSFSVGGKMLDAPLYQTVKPGKYAEAFIYFEAAEIGGSDVANLRDVEGTIQIRQEDTLETLSETEVSFPDAADLSVVDIS